METDDRFTMLIDLLPDGVRAYPALPISLPSPEPRPWSPQDILQEMEELANGTSMPAAKRARLHHQERLSSMSMTSRESILSDTSSISSAPPLTSSAHDARFSLLNALHAQEAMHKRRAPTTNTTSQPPTPEGVVRACVVRRPAA